MNPADSELSDDPGWTLVATKADFHNERKLVCEVDGQSVLLCRLGSEIVAVRNYCTHLGKPLDRGRIMAGQITCAFHGACFDLRTGASLSGPAVVPLQRYALRIIDDDIWLERPAPSTQTSGYPRS